MEKRYQVFVSSTFEDLKDERQAVLRAILELDHMPAGMELFPAVDDDAWQLIRDVIDASDYYVVIIGGRYGSLDEAGISFTEKEYEYAVQVGRPVVALLHKNPDNLPRDRTEVDGKAWEKLKLFRARVEKAHTCVYWTSTEDLKSRVIVSLTAEIKRRPATGWVRADKVPSGDTLQELLALRNKITDLEEQLAQANTGPPPGTETLAHGEDVYPVEGSFVSRDLSDPYPYSKDKKYRFRTEPSWDAVFAAVAPCMIDEAKDVTLRTRLADFLLSRVRKEARQEKTFKAHKLIDFSYEPSTLDTCVVQLRALGLIRESSRKRSVKEAGTYWTLTPYGDQRMVQLRALRRHGSERAELTNDDVETEAAQPGLEPDGPSARGLTP